MEIIAGSWNSDPRSADLTGINGKAGLVDGDNTSLPQVEEEENDKGLPCIVKYLSNFKV